MQWIKEDTKLGDRYSVVGPEGDWEGKSWDGYNPNTLNTCDELSKNVSIQIFYVADI